MRFPDRESAAPVLARLHIGESKKAWSLDEQAKFVLAQLTDGLTVEVLKEQLPAIKDVVRLVRMGRVREMLRQVPFEDPSLAEYASSDRLAMSSFEYAYRNADIQAAIGVAFDDTGHLTSTTATPAHITALARLLRGFKSGELNTRRGLKPGTEEFKRLLAEMRGDASTGAGNSGTNWYTGASGNDRSASNGAGPNTGGYDGEKTARAHGASSGSATAGDESPAAADGEQKGRGPNKPETKKYLDLSGIDESQLPLPLKHRIRELRRIDLVDFPAAAAMLTRSVLEAAIKEHYGIKSGPAATGTLGTVMTRVTNDYGQDGQLAHAISTINRTKKGASTTPGTGEWFNLVAHSVNIDVTAQQVHQAWRVVFPLLRFLLQHLTPPVVAP